jgi:hypothetical protein
MAQRTYQRTVVLQFYWCRFTSLWFGIYLGLPLEQYKIVSWKKKKFEDLKHLLVCFRLYFVIVKDSSCNSTMYYLLL